MNIERLKSPKRRTVSRFFREHWYPYYAGFSSEFVESVLNIVDTDIDGLLDPWNGSGTSTSVGNAYGLNSIGIDINPVMTIVARARNLSSQDSIKAKTIAFDTVVNYKPHLVESDSLLKNWFADSSATLVSGIFYSFLQVSSLSREDVRRGEVDSPKALVLLAIFQALKSISHSLKSNNPTWTRKKLEEGIEINKSDFFYSIVKYAGDNIAQSVFRDNGDTASPKLITGDCQNLSFLEEKFDLIIGSPPYATRIDYAIKTSLELAVIGYTHEDLKILRASMMGTTSINNLHSRIELSDFTENTLRTIKQHGSKASSGYYYKTYRDYFTKLENSITECCKVLQVNGYCFFVIQDSYYKDIHIDLTNHIVHSLRNKGFKSFQTVDFLSSVSMRNINKGHKVYGYRTNPVETVLIVRR